MVVWAWGRFQSSVFAVVAAAAAAFVRSLVRSFQFVSLACSLDIHTILYLYWSNEEKEPITLYLPLCSRPTFKICNSLFTAPFSSSSCWFYWAKSRENERMRENASYLKIIVYPHNFERAYATLSIKHFGVHSSFIRFLIRVVWKSSFFSAVQFNFILVFVLKKKVEIFRFWIFLKYFLIWKSISIFFRNFFIQCFYFEPT